MDVTYSSVLNLLTSTTGSAFYHLVLAISVAGAFQVAYALKGGEENKARLRLAKGLLGLLLVVLISLVVLVLSLAVEDLNNLLPPLDRMFSALSAMIIVWIWAFPVKHSRTDLILWTALVFLVAGGIASSVLWANSGLDELFNGTLFDRSWMVLSILLPSFGVLILILRRPDSWELGVVMLLALFIGSFIHLIFPNEGNFPGAQRLTQIAAYPFLFSIPLRFSRGETPTGDEKDSFPQRKDTMNVASSRHDQPGGADQRLITSFLALAVVRDPKKICAGLTRSISHALVAEVCLLFAPPTENEQFVLLCGYDLVRESTLPGASISAANLPNLTTSVERSRSLRLPEKSKSPDLITLAKALNQSKAGSLLAHTILAPDNAPLAVLVLLTPYSRRNWEKQTENLLTSLSPYFARLLDFDREDESAVDTQEKADKELESLTLQKEAFSADLELSKQKIAEQEETIDNLETLLTAINTKAEQMEQIQAENQLLREQMDDLTAQHANTATTDEEKESSEEMEQLFENLEIAHQKIALLQEKLKKVSSAPKPEADEASPGLSLEQAEMIASIAQDVRQPLSSITGYTDLLLGESVGILGALQKKFLERVKTSTDRMNALIGDLVQVTGLDSGSIELTSEAVDLGTVFDDALANTGAQLREKNISLRVDLPDELPRLHADRDALLQIIQHLMHNAGDASPSDGEISLRARLEQDEQTEAEYAIIQVTDTGGGIPEEELPRVFSRLYQDDNPLIEGVGDTGVGLSIAKTLAEALGGEMWVETQGGIGSTFNIRLPLTTDPSDG